MNPSSNPNASREFPPPSMRSHDSSFDPSFRTAARSQRHSSIRDNTVTFLRNIFANRMSDYHSDAPPQELRNEAVSPEHQRGPNWAESGAVHDGSVVGSSFMVVGGGGVNNNNNNINRITEEPAEPSLWQRLTVRSDRRALFLDILYSRFWKTTLFIFAIILLFGAPCRALFIPKAGDSAVDAVFCVVFVFFVTDMGMRMDAEDHYFEISCGSGGKRQSSWCCCRIGSFLFWCDFLSTFTLLADITWFNKEQFSESQFEITLNSFGVPISGFKELNPGQPVQIDLVLLVTISQTARVARFIRSSRAVNGYFLVNLFDPSWWCHRCSQRRWRRGRRSSGSENKNTTPSSDLGSDTVHSKSHPRMSWNAVSMGALAIVKAKAAAQGKSGWRGWTGKFMRLLGRPYFSTTDFRRHYAAVRIQRAWRAVVEQRETAADESEFMGQDVAWKGRPSIRASLVNPVEREMKLRSARKLTEAVSSTTNLVDSPGSGLLNDKKKRSESQVGSAMRELTGQRVAIGIMIALFLSVIFTYVEYDTTRHATMVVLMNQTGYANFANRSIVAARSSSIPDLFSYTFANGNTTTFDVVEDGLHPDELRANERMRITVSDAFNRTTVGLFSYRNERQEEALVQLLSTIFILLVWFFGVAAFAGPVLILVVIPIERMVRLLTMLMIDPLGYQNTSRYKRFVDEENEITKYTSWTPEILKGMETSFLMSTILRIGNLMKVGFGSAGVEIIRNNLEKGQSSKNMLILSSQGSTVSCIFLFCDIRAFTDATECLQEEVFVFTNRIAGVVHSNCHSLGGSANKNIGDAFLVSWRLDEDTKQQSGGRTGHDSFSSHTQKSNAGGFTAKHHQADKALLSVVRICMALHYDDYYLEAMTNSAREALVEKLKKRKGRIVQMGFGLHAGRAVQGAIGSQRKIDATYVSEAVERAEFLESSTKKYKLKMLMSDSFHRLLHPNNRRRCRKVDQILIREDEEEDEEEEDDVLNGDIMELFTFDMDIDALWTDNNRKDLGRDSDTASEAEPNKRAGMAKMPRARRTSARKKDGFENDEMSESGASGVFGLSSTNHSTTLGLETEGGGPLELVLPTGPVLYNASVWTSDEMRTIRELYSDGLFFQKFMSGLHSFYSKDWDNARQCFAVILERFEDGPSRYFMNQIEKHNGKPPRGFRGYGTAA